MANISDAEWVFMDLLWEHEELTITQMEQLLKEGKGWSKHAIISFLKKMEAKGLVQYRMVGKAKSFFTTLEQDEVRKRESIGFLDKVFRGKLGLMVSSLVEEDCLEKEEIDELMAILEQKREER
ncbi:MAG: BlaI/MecI/CopY family transcriptional regulator [Bacteroidales bacterium]|nr:BlaI/MecI/CopY family transcriptional regulator [Clostridium sp.]MCM1203752.1 BlaI/MecI/CopY family transcriptional regulator [Bacteroidales bacterium]